MEYADIQKKTEADLTKALADKREELRAFRFGGAGSRTRDVKAGRTIKKVIARILTELRMRTIAKERKDA